MAPKISNFSWKNEVSGNWSGSSPMISRMSLSLPNITEHDLEFTRNLKIGSQKWWIQKTQNWLRKWRVRLLYVQRRLDSSFLMMFHCVFILYWLVEHISECSKRVIRGQSGPSLRFQKVRHLGLWRPKKWKLRFFHVVVWAGIVFPRWNVSF